MHHFGKSEIVVQYQSKSKQMMLQEQASSGNMYHLSIYCIIYTILLTIERKCGACEKLVQDGEAAGALHTKHISMALSLGDIYNSFGELHHVSNNAFL